MAVTERALTNDDVALNGDIESDLKTVEKPAPKRVSAKAGDAKKAGTSKTKTQAGTKTPAVTSTSTAKKAPARRTPTKRTAAPKAAPARRAPATKSVGRLLAEVEKERKQLERAIAEAKELLFKYTSAAEIRRQKTATEIAPLIFAAHETLMEAEREHFKALANIEAEADREIAKILGVAKEEVAMVRSATALTTSGQPSKLIAPPAQLADKTELVDKA